jgi:hypothetical protein
VAADKIEDATTPIDRAIGTLRQERPPTVASLPPRQLSGYARLDNTTAAM